MSVQPRRVVLVCGVVPAVIVALLSLYRPAFLERLEYASYDALLRAARTHPPGGDVVIVDVDERSLSSVGQWPWRRDPSAASSAAFATSAPPPIALDIVFAESDRYAGAGAATDEAMAGALAPRQGRARLCADVRQFYSRPSSACVQHPLGLVMVRRGDDGHPSRSSRPLAWSAACRC